VHWLERHCWPVLAGLIALSVLLWIEPDRTMRALRFFVAPGVVLVLVLGVYYSPGLPSPWRHPRGNDHSG